MQYCCSKSSLVCLWKRWKNRPVAQLGQSTVNSPGARGTTTHRGSIVKVYPFLCLSHSVFKYYAPTFILQLFLHHLSARPRPSLGGRKVTLEVSGQLRALCQWGMILPILEKSLKVTWCGCVSIIIPTVILGHVATESFILTFDLKLYTWYM